MSVEGTSASVGITEYAAQQLGDVVYISLPTLGATVTAGEPCGEVESVKSVSDLYSPVDGEVTEVNTELEEILPWSTPSRTRPAGCSGCAWPRAAMAKRPCRPTCCPPRSTKS